MQKWEYMTFGVYGEKVLAVNGESIDKNVSFFGKPNGEPLTEFLNKMGQEGWELSGSLGVEEDWMGILKRPL